MNDMKVSIITYCHVSRKNKRLPFLLEALESVSGQNFDDYEHLIIDDGSTINIESHVNKYKNTKYFFKKKTGITKTTATFNFGFKKAAGEYAIILASDDFQTKTCLSELTKILDNNKKLVAVVGGAIYQQPNKQRYFLPNVTNHYESLIKNGNHINGCAIMFRMKFFRDEIKPYPIDITSFCADFDMWVKLAEIGPIEIIDIPVVVYRDHADATRHKTAEKYLKKPKSGINWVENLLKKIRWSSSTVRHYPFSKNTRLNFVRESSHKRMCKFDKPNTDSSLIIKNLLYPSSSKISDGIANKFLIEEFSKLDFSTKDRRKQIYSKFSPMGDYISKFSIIKLYGLSPLTVLASYLVNPEQYISWYMCKELATSKYTDMMNWAMIDNISYDKKRELNDSLSVLGLTHYTSIDIIDLRSWISDRKNLLDIREIKL